MPRRIDTIVIHCSATREHVNYSFDDCVRDHKARGFYTCGYHFFIDRDGTIHVGRELDVIGAHVQGHNSHSVGICYAGGLDRTGKPKDTRTEEQKMAIIECIDRVVNYSPTRIKRICGHRDLSPDRNANGIVEPDEWIKMCPCFDAEPEYELFLKLAYEKDHIEQPQ